MKDVPLKPYIYFLFNICYAKKALFLRYSGGTLSIYKIYATTHLSNYLLCYPFAKTS